MWEHLSDELNYNVMFSPRGAMFLGHSDADMTKLAERGDAMRCDGIDADLMTRDEVRKLEPLLDMSRSARFPIEGGLIQRRGGTARHDAVAWGYARGADSLGVDIIQKCEVTGFVRDGDAVVGVDVPNSGRSNQIPKRAKTKPSIQVFLPFLTVTCWMLITSKPAKTMKAPNTSRANPI